MFISKARPNQLDECMRMLVTCFIENATYTKLFPDRDTRAEQIRANFRQDIEFCLNHGYCYLMIERNSIIGMLFAHDYKKLMLDHPADAQHLFGDTFPQSLHDLWSSIPGNVLYFMLTCVHPAWVAHDVTQRLFEAAFKYHPDTGYVAQVDKKDFIKVFEEKGFLIEYLSESMWHAVKPPVDETLEYMHITPGFSSLIWEYRRLFDGHELPGAPRIMAFPNYTSWFENHGKENIFVAVNGMTVYGMFAFDKATREFQVSVHPKYRQRGFGYKLSIAALSYMCGVGVDHAIAIPGDDTASLKLVQKLHATRLEPGKYEVRL